MSLKLCLPLAVVLLATAIPLVGANTRDGECWECVKTACGTTGSGCNTCAAGGLDWTNDRTECVGSDGNQCNAVFHGCTNHA